MGHGGARVSAMLEEDSMSTCTVFAKVILRPEAVDIKWPKRSSCQVGVTEFTTSLEYFCFPNNQVADFNASLPDGRWTHSTISYLYTA